MPKFYSVNEAAQALGISVSFFNKLLANGDFFVHKFGDRNLVAEDDLFDGAARHRRNLRDQKEAKPRP